MAQRVNEVFYDSKACVRTLCEAICNLNKNSHPAHDLNRNFGKVATINND